MTHQLLSFLRQIVCKLNPKSFSIAKLPRILDADMISRSIKNIIASDKPCMIARFGSNELDITARYISMQKYRNNYMSYILGKTPNWWWEQSLIKRFQNNAGFINPSQENLIKFSKQMIEDMKLVDILGSWRKDEMLFKEELCNALKVKMMYLEPFWSSSPWTQALKGKKVLVIHPFADTIKKQYEKRELLFKNKDILPEFASLRTIKAVQSIGNDNQCQFTNWFDALHFMEQQMDVIDYDICLIGCGAYGFMLAAHAKRTGHKAVHLGGALQLLFGIIGKRWFSPSNTTLYSIYKDLLNEYWTTPSESEKPNAAKTVEGGCYW